MSKSILPGGRITNRAGRERPRFIRPVERQRMRPWLEEHLDKNDIPGLTWVEKNERIFRIAWKHAANQCFNLQKDTNLFERWAIHTGRHYDSDHKRWKANFRCALNSLPDVKENKEQGIKKGNNAFKVYRFLDEKETRGAKETKVKKRTAFGSDDTIKSNDDDNEDYGSTEQISVDDEERESQNLPSMPKLDQLYPSTGVEMLIEAGFKGAKEKMEPLTDTSEDTNLQEILAAATASLAAGSDPATLENISINQLKRLGDVSLMRLDVRQSVKKSTSGFMYVFLCRWCEKVFPRKIELFQHFLVMHQDKLLAGEDYGDQAGHDKSDPKHQKLLEEIQDLEQKVLGFSEKSYQSSEAGSEEASEDQMVPSDKVETNTELEDKALDLTMKAKISKLLPKQETALDLSLSTGKKLKFTKHQHGKLLGKRRRSSQETELTYSMKFGNYGIAGTPRTKRQMSLHSRKKEEEQERMAKKIMTTEGSDPSRQHSMEDIVHAEMLLSLKTGNDEGSEKGSGKSTSKKENNGKGKKGKSYAKRSLKTSKILDRERMADSRESDEEYEKWMKSTEKNDSELLKTVKAYKCGLCFQRFTSPGTLFLHVESHAGTFVHVCNQCGKKCESHQDLLEHVGSSHPSVTHRCNFCWKLCRTVKKLKNHMWLHISVCKKCGERFYNPELLDIHLLEEHGIKAKKQKQKQQKSKPDTETKSEEEVLDEHIDEEEEDEEEDEEEEDEMGVDNESNATTEIAEDSDNDPDNDTTDILIETDITDNIDHSNDIKEEPDSESENDIKDSKESVDGTNKSDIKEEGETDIIKTDNEKHDSAMEDNMKAGTVESSKNIPNLEELTKDTFEGEQQQVDSKDNTFNNVNADLVPNSDVKMEIKSEDYNNVTFISTSNEAERTDTEKTKKDDEEPNKDEVSGISDVADRIKAAEKMLNLINGNTVKGHDVEIFKVRANQLISIMNTAEIGNCLICNKAVTMNLMISHIKTHSIVELSRAKDALDLMNIKIHALERPLFLCNLCNLGFDSCETLAAHVTKHLTPSGKQKGAGSKKRKLDTDIESTKVKVMKTSQAKSKTTLAAKKATQTSPVSSASADKKKIIEVCGKKEGVSSGSILAAYLNAGPKYQASSLTKFIKQSQDVADKTNVNSAGENQALSGPALTKTSTAASGSMSDKVQTKSITGFSKDKKDVESAIGNTQCIAIPSQSGTVLLSVNSKGDNTTKEGSRPIPLMFLKDEKSPDLKIVPASSLMQLTQELGTNLKSSQLIKVIPPSLLPSQLGKTKLDQTNMLTTNSSTALNSASSLTAPSLSVTSSLNRSIVVARPSGDGNSLSEGAGPKSVFVVPSTVLRHFNESGEAATELNESKKVNDSSDSTHEDSVLKAFTDSGSVDKASDFASAVQPTMAKSISASQTISGSLPASILHGQNLPLSLQNSQVRLVSPGNVSQSGGQQQITILKWPMTVQMGRITSPSLGIKTKTESFAGQMPTTQSSSSINAQASMRTTSSGVSTALNKTNSLHLESLLKKPPLSGQASGISSTSAASSPSISVVKPPSSLMNVMLSQYLRSQGVLSSSVANLKGMATPTPKPVPSEPATVTSVGQKPTFNLVITQTPPTQPTVTSNQSTAGNIGLVNRLGVTIKQENQSETESGSMTGSLKTSPAPVTQRLALICSLCMTELQNLEMISQHVCPAGSSSLNPPMIKDVMGDGGRPTGGVVFPCIICNQDFYDLDIILAHRRGHNLLGSSRLCQLCSMCFVNDVSYGNHLKTCHSKRIPVCPLCKQTFPDQKTCVEHLEKDHSAETKCDLCEENTRLFLNASDLTLHMIFAHPFECPSCDFRCVKERELWSHILNHPKTHKQSETKTNQGVSQSHEQGVICKKCLVGFVSLQTFQIHVRLLHPGESFESLMEINPEKCHLCDFSFKHKKTLHQHLETFHMRKLVYFCSVCNQNCATPSLLVRHLKEHLKKSMLEIKFCHLCRKVFPRKSLYTQHMRVTHGIVEVSHGIVEVSLNRSSKSLFSTVSGDSKSVGPGNNSVGDQALMLQAVEETVITCDLGTKEKSALSDSTKMEFVDVHKTLSDTIDLKVIGSHKTLSDTMEIVDIHTTLSDTKEMVVVNDHKTLSDTKETDCVDGGKTPPNLSLKCDTCGIEGFKSRFLLKQHQVIRHVHPHARTSSSYYQHVIENIKRPKSFDCVQCGTRFDNKNAFKMHKNCRRVKVDRRKLYGCALCKKTFYKLMKLTKHMWNHDQSDASTCTGEGNDSKRDSKDTCGIGRFMCNICSECFHDSASLFQHAKCHLEKSKLEAMARNKLKHAVSVTGDPTKIPSNW